MREFRRNHGERVRVWVISVFHDTIRTAHGWRGGACQQTTDVPGASSRETAEERALSRANKLIKDKLNKGYTEYVPGTDTIIGDEAGTEVTFDGKPPEGLEVFKPRPMPKKGDKEWKKLQAVLDRGDEVVTKKYDGMKHLVMKDKLGRVSIYTRRMEDATYHYPWLVGEFMTLIPDRTILACELYVKSREKEDFRNMQSLSRSLADRAAELQKADPFLRPHAVVLAPVYWGGEPLIKTMKVIEWMEFLNESLTHKGYRGFVHTMRVFYGGLANAFKHVEKEGFEGLVVYDGEATFGEKAFNFRGKSERPDCWKQKPIYEEEFIAVFGPQHKGKCGWKELGSYGRGKNMDRVGNLALYQLDRRKNPVYICNVGTGLDDAARKEIAEASKETPWVDVVSVEYAGRKYISKGQISNALTFPSFQKIHEDKTIGEVINEELG